jgi:hypothetical protein
MQAARCLLRRFYRVGTGMRMTIADPRPVLGRDYYAVNLGTGILRRSRRFLREAGALIVRCLQQAGTPANGIGRVGDHRGAPPTGRVERGQASGETPSTRRRALHGRRGTSRWHARPQSQPVRSYTDCAAADRSERNQPSDPAIARLLRQQACRIAHSADPVDALAAVIDLVIDSDADPYHLIGVLAEGAVQTLTHRIPSERRRVTAMALVQLMLDRLQFGRME